MADINCKLMPGMGKFAFYPLSKAGKDWFENMVGAVPDKNAPYLAEQETAAELTKKMLVAGMVINDADHTSRFRAKFDIKEPKATININDVVVASIPVPDKLDRGDTERLHGMRVCWDRPADFPPHWVEGRNRLTN